MPAQLVGLLVLIQLPGGVLMLSDHIAHPALWPVDLEALVHQNRAMRRSAEGRGQRVIQIEDGFAADIIRQGQMAATDFRTISPKGEVRLGYAGAVVIEDGDVRAGADPPSVGAVVAALR